jgi:hypothetical protein
MPKHTPQQNMNRPVAVANPSLANLLDTLFERRLSGATRLVAVGGGVDLKYTAGPPDRNAPLAAHLVNQLALPDRLQSFRRTAS